MTHMVVCNLVCPEHAGDAIQSPASAGAKIEGECTPGKPYYRLRLYGHVPRHQVTHAPPLGRAHIAPVNPGAIGCDRPERAQRARGRGS